MLPNLKLAIIFANLAKKHGGTVLHLANTDKLTEDLGNALQQQKNILSDPRKSSLMTAYDILPVIMEVKILSLAVAKKLDVPTKGRAVIDILDDIVRASDARGGDHADGIRDTLEWTRKLFAAKEIQDVLNMEITEIERPAGIRGIGKFVKQVAVRSKDEIVRLNEFLQRTKDVSKKKRPPKPPASA
jgi:hypothetical protein